MPSRDRGRDGGDLSAIFVHAGAGFHSYGNERYHLAACQDACKVAMTILKNGGGAVDAVEMAIKVMEDREITNSGYGSNLSMDGEVECDATIVDHFGRSGAVGAVGQIKNPISLARLVLQESTRPLSLQRVPPNLLVGEGAVNFAYSHRMPILPKDFLVAPGARERWLRWKQDLDIADEDMRKLGRVPNEGIPATFDHLSPPMSPLGSRDMVKPQAQSNLTAIGTSLRPLSESAADPMMGDLKSSSRAYNQLSTTAPAVYTASSRDPSIDGSEMKHKLPSIFDLPIETRPESPPKRARLNHSHAHHDGPAATGDSAHDMEDEPKLSSFDVLKDEDQIFDTVGAIAVDCLGNIAAGSSSGGIGMKHRGRTGPAALVGIGTAVIPPDPDDSTHTTVATVSSGTGEHMATTMAATTCSERIYSHVRRKRGGGLEYATEEESMRTMIEKEFMGHPGVKNSNCTAAIGLMSVKKTVDGIFLYFAHNTDSFAIASMHSEEKKPVSVMSRSIGGGAIAQGGRVARHRRR